MFVKGFTISHRMSRRVHSLMSTLVTPTTLAPEAGTHG